MAETSLDLRVGENYRLLKKIGSGSFGEVFLGRHVLTGEHVAIKLEESKMQHPQLHYESKVYKVLSGGVGIPNIKWYGVEGEYNGLVMDLLGPSLEDQFNACRRRFSLKTVLLLGDQMLARLQFVHDRQILHRDIKPDNFLFGLERNAGLVSMIDFGLAKKFWLSQKDEHIPYKEGKSLTGTARYASINSHRGLEQSRRDDMESLGFVLLYFLRGSLPWQGLAAKSKKEKYMKISEMKQSTPVESLCNGDGAVFLEYMRYVRALEFVERPDYEFLRRLMSKEFSAREFSDNRFDWEEQGHLDQLQQREHRREHAQEASSGAFAGVEAAVEVVSKSSAVYGGSIDVRGRPPIVTPVSPTASGGGFAAAFGGGSIPKP